MHGHDHLQPHRLTPGVRDGAARTAFFHGACAALAIALHDETGWPIVAVTDHDNEYDGRMGMGGSAMHWLVRRPDGALIDFDGAHTPEEILEAYHDEADDGIAALATTTREDALERYEAQGAEIPVSLARKFVAGVLRQAEQDSSP